MDYRRRKFETDLESHIVSLPRTPRHQVDLTEEVSVSPYATLDFFDHQLIDELHVTLGLEAMEEDIERVVCMPR